MPSLRLASAAALKALALSASLFAIEIAPAALAADGTPAQSTAEATRIPSAASAGQDFSRVINDAYILGFGDSLLIELLDIPELSGTFSIGPDGTIYLPRLRSLYVEGLTIEELRYFLVQQFKAYVKDPQVYINPVEYRSVRVYVGGEIARPGYYQLSINQARSAPIAINPSGTMQPSNNASGRTSASGAIRRGAGMVVTDAIRTSMGINSENSSPRWPTLFDALQAAQGVTPFSDLGAVQVTRRQPIGSGGGRMRTSVNFLQMITTGNEDVNIRLFDGDAISVNRSSKVMLDQLLTTSRSNLSPNFLQVFVSGRVKEIGPVTVPQGSSLNQAIAGAGGPRLLRGNVEFLRFNPGGTLDRRLFSFDSDAKIEAYNNPLLMMGDIIRINDSILSASVEIFNEITAPLLGFYSFYNLFPR